MIIVYVNYFFYLHSILCFYKSGGVARVTVYGRSGVEAQDPAKIDPIDLQLARGATISGTPQTSTPSETRVIDTKSLLEVTPFQGDKASFLGWKFSFWTAVTAISEPLHEGLEKIEDNINQDSRSSRLPTGHLELSDQAYTLLAFHCKDEACASVRSAEDGIGNQAWQVLLRARTARNATNFSIQLLEPKFTSRGPRITFRRWENAEENGTRTGERVSAWIRTAVHMTTCTTRHATTFDFGPVFVRLKRLPRKLEITGMELRIFRVITRNKLDSLLQFVKTL